MSAYATTFYEARERCRAEGADLAHIPNKLFIEGLDKILQELKNNPDTNYYDSIDSMWFGGISMSKESWVWLNYPNDFDKFTMWESNTKGIIHLLLIQATGQVNLCLT